MSEPDAPYFRKFEADEDQLSRRVKIPMMLEVQFVTAATLEEMELLEKVVEAAM